MSALTSTIQNYIYGPDKFSKPKKNFIKENMRHIKKMQLEPKEQKTQSKKIQMKKSEKRLGEGRNKNSIQKSHEKLVPDSDKNLIPDFKEQGSQTSINDLDGGTVRFPNERNVKTPPAPIGKKNISLQVDPVNDLINKRHENLTILTPSEMPIKEDGKVDFVRLNMLTQYKKKVCADKPDPTKVPPSYQKGVVPKYILEAKKQQIEEVQEKGLVELIDDTDDKCYSLISDDVKKERIREIRLAFAQLVTELNSLPMRSDSLKMKKRREHIEGCLHKLEDGIKLFSREKLYLKQS